MIAHDYTLDFTKITPIAAMPSHGSDAHIAWIHSFDHLGVFVILSVRGME